MRTNKTVCWGAFAVKAARSEWNDSPDSWKNAVRESLKEEFFEFLENEIYFDGFDPTETEPPDFYVDNFLINGEFTTKEDFMSDYNKDKEMKEEWEELIEEYEEQIKDALENLEERAQLEAEGSCHDTEPARRAVEEAKAELEAQISKKAEWEEEWIDRAWEAFREDCTLSNDEAACVQF